MKSSRVLISFFLGCILLIFLIFQSTALFSESIPLPKGTKADKILVEKEKRQLHLLSKGKRLKTYQISLGFNPLGHKEQQGDGKTPEGLYKIEGKNPKSSYHLSLRVSYPNKNDQEQAQKKGVSPGGDIMIHGLPNGFDLGKIQRMADWTAGCIAVTNDEIEEIWRAVDVGTLIEILP